MTESVSRLVGEIQEEIQRLALEGKAKEYYIKAIRARLAVNVIDPFTGESTVRMLMGDTNNPNLDKDQIIVPLYTEYDKKYFLRANKQLIEDGYIVPFTPEIRESQLVNAVSDEELKEALDKRFFAVKALLDKFTSPAPVERMLRMAKEMNKTIGTVNAIEARLAELQEQEYHSVSNKIEYGV